jgi:hypothetical protein
MTYRPPTLKTLSLTVVVALLASIGLFVSRPIDVVVDGAHMDSDVPPVATAGDVYIPLRSMATALGARTIVDGKGSPIVVIHDRDSLKVRVGSVHAQLDGMPMTLERAPFQVRGRVMVSLRTISRAFGVRTSYDAVAGRINVMSPGIGDVPTPQGVFTEATQ